MKFRIAQLNFKIADFEGNLAKMARAISQAAGEGVDLVIFSELSLCGYPPLDLLEQRDFIDACQGALRKLAEMTGEVGVIVGAPAYNENDKGKKLYNAAYLLHQGRVQAVRYKTLLPTYDIFDEYRYFEPNNVFETIDFKGVRIALTICEDIWDDQPVENAFARSKLYTVSPMEHLIRQKPAVMINISASPFAANRLSVREEVLRSAVQRYGIPILYSNQVGAHTELIFDGSSLALDSTGGVVGRLPAFGEGEATFLLEDLANCRGGRVMEGRANLSDEYRIEMIHNALIFGIKDYFQKMGFKRAVLGLSGGMDSALTLVLAVQALGRQNVLPVLMPSRFSSDHSIGDSIELAKNLEVKWETIPID
ncbi:MAG: nitrilase-related carbon-nitrogen hydrolase, partial [Bacteroidales bacterium]